MDRHPVVGVLGRELLDGDVVAADQGRSRLGEVPGAVTGQARFPGQVCGRVGPVLHATGPDHDHVGRLQLRSLAPEGVLEFGGADAEAVGQDVDTDGGGHVDQDPPADEGRQAIGPGHPPVQAPQVVVGGEAIPDGAVVAEVVEGVDVGPAVGEHRHRIRRPRHQLVLGPADTHRIVHHRPPGGVDHPDVVGRLATGGPGGHVHEQVDRQVEHPAAVGPGQLVAGDRGCEEVDHPHLVVAPEGARGR